MLELSNPFNNCQGFTFRYAVVSFGRIQLSPGIGYDHFSSILFHILLSAEHYAYGIIACIGGQLKGLGEYWGFSECLLQRVKSLLTVFIPEEGCTLLG